MSSRNDVSGMQIHFYNIQKEEEEEEKDFVFVLACSGGAGFPPPMERVIYTCTTTNSI